MKTEEEIRNEMEAIKRTIKNNRNAYNRGNIPKNVFKSVLQQNNSMLVALTWVLGDNDRYD